MDFAPFMSAGKGGYAVPSTEKGRKGFAFPGAPAKPPDGQCAWGNRFFPRHTHIRRAALQRLCPHGANSVEYAHSQRPLPARARQRHFPAPRGHSRLDFSGGSSPEGSFRQIRRHDARRDFIRFEEAGRDTWMLFGVAALGTWCAVFTHALQEERDKRFTERKKRSVS